jgi:ATP-binding cassette subfamily B protein
MTGAELSGKIYYLTLYQPYSVHVARNSSEVITGILSKVDRVIYRILLPAVSIINATLLLIAILGALTWIEPRVSMSLFGGLSLIYLTIIFMTRKKLRANSAKIAMESTNVAKALQEGLGGIRDVLISGTQATYLKLYQASDGLLRRSQSTNLFISQSPRYALEALSMVVVAALAYRISGQSNGVGGAIPILGVLVLGAQRLLPVLQQGYGAWSDIKGEQSTLGDVLKLLDQPPPAFNGNRAAPNKAFFREKITLKNIFFRYGLDTPWILQDINLVIPKGARVGFIGATGSGKSTLLDIVMGLLEPSAGLVKIDDVIISSANTSIWQSHISHVPQSIFLADSSIEENIAFGVPREEINKTLVREAARRAQISDMIESWADQYNTIVGERGIRLSGGQRQRIGIARAFYTNADTIIFDEATSALDYQTEASLINAIDGLGSDITVLVIAHRLGTLKNCNVIVELENSRIKRVGSYDEIIKNHDYN